MASQLFWHNIYNGLNLLTHEFKDANYTPDLIIGIGRGGLIPATLLAYKLKVKSVMNYSIQTYKDDNTQDENFVIIQEPSAEISNYKTKNVLVIDDLSDTGTTFQYIVDRLRANYNLENIKTATLCIKEHTKFIPDFYIQKYSSDTWLTFPWEVDGSF